MTSIVMDDGSVPTTPTPAPTPAPAPAPAGAVKVYVASANFLHPLGEFRDGVGYELAPADAKGLVDAGLLTEKV